MVTLDIASVVRWLWRIVVFLSVMNLGFIVIHRVFGYEGVLGLASAFRTNLEQNVPTWYSVCALCAAALLLLAVGGKEQQAQHPCATHWLALGLIFLVLSLDELISLHELWAFPLTYFFPRQFPHRAWYLLAPLPLLVLAVVYWRFWKSLAPSTRHGLCLAAGLYVGGAVGVESIEGLFYHTTESHNLGTDLASAVEEAMEMSGVVVLIRTLLQRLAAGSELTLRIE